MVIASLPIAAPVATVNTKRKVLNCSVKVIVESIKTVFVVIGQRPLRQLFRPTATLRIAFMIPLAVKVVQKEALPAVTVRGILLHSME